uniref:Methyltransferase domain-containing protein n=1 Tax=Emiliania huxleyi TaxID=2903 RepID=A0A7S3VXG4_EMIHU
MRAVTLLALTRSSRALSMPPGGYTSRTMDPNAGAVDAQNPAKMLSPSCDRNKAAILSEYLTILPSSGRALEVASGTGQHVAHFAAALPGVRFCPSDLTTDAFGSVAAWAEGLDNVEAPFAHDCASVSDWAKLEPKSFDAVIVANMCHISPWMVTEGLFTGAAPAAGFRARPRRVDTSTTPVGAARVLADGGRLCVYGPFTTGGEHTSESNADFDRSLRARDPSWGYRDIERDLGALADKAGVALLKRIAMPANNFLLVYARCATEE